MRWLAWPALIIIAIGACSASDGGADRAGSDQPGTPNPSAKSPGRAAVPARILDPILADAARRAGVDPAAVAVIRAEQRTWGDGSLGCPQPGMYYTQVQVEGYQVIASAGGMEYDYRAGAGRFLVCRGGVPAT